MVKIEPLDDIEIDESSNIAKINLINLENFENVIEDALRKRCFIGAISLIHNTIELYLQSKLKRSLSDKKNEGKTKLLKQIGLLKNEKAMYLKDYSAVCYILDLIGKEEYRAINSFNEGRNWAMHRLMRKPISIGELKRIARSGRKIQLQLSPLNHSKKDIRSIMAHFDEITKD